MPITIAKEKNDVKESLISFLIFFCKASFVLLLNQNDYFPYFTPMLYIKNNELKN